MTTPLSTSEGATGPTITRAKHYTVRRPQGHNQIDGIFGRAAQDRGRAIPAHSQQAIDGVACAALGDGAGHSRASGKTPSSI